MFVNCEGESRFEIQSSKFRLRSPYLSLEGWLVAQRLKSSVIVKGSTWLWGLASSKHLEVQGGEEAAHDQDSQPLPQFEGRTAWRPLCGASTRTFGLSLAAHSGVSGDTEASTPGG